MREIAIEKVTEKDAEFLFELMNDVGWSAGSENDVRNFQSEKSAPKRVLFSQTNMGIYEYDFKLC